LGSPATLTDELDNPPRKAAGGAEAAGERTADPNSGRGPLQSCWRGNPTHLKKGVKYQGPKITTFERS